MELSCSSGVRSLELVLPWNAARKAAVATAAAASCSSSVSGGNGEVWPRNGAARRTSRGCCCLRASSSSSSSSSSSTSSSSSSSSPSSSSPSSAPAASKDERIEQRNSAAAANINVKGPSAASPFEGDDSGVRVLEHMSALVRVTYGIGIYGVMALAGKAICCFTGVDSLGGLELSLDAILNGIGYAVPPMMALLFILDDEVVKLCRYARAIRDVEDEELINFFLGMSPWQFMLTVTASSVGEELFYRVAVQGSLSHIFMNDCWQTMKMQGIASLIGLFPAFAPFAQGFAAVITAALTGSFYYMAASPKDPTYIVAAMPRNPLARADMKKCFAVWYERRQLKKIYSPLLESLLALYLGFEWIQTSNILATMITHTIYSAVVLGNGLWRIHDHRNKIRRRTKKIWQNSVGK